jgi:hypothetical protein
MIALLEHEEKENKKEITETVGCHGCQEMYTILVAFIFENVEFHFGNCCEMYNSLCCSVDEFEEVEEVDEFDEIDEIDQIKKFDEIMEFDKIDEIE